MKKIIKKILNKLANYLAKKDNFRFPDKYTWKWKIKMIFHEYEPKTTNKIKQIVKPGMTIVDIGSHIGYFTRIFSDLVGKDGKVLAFEPNRDNFELLESNTEHLNNFRLYRFAISDIEGEKTFYNSTKTGCHSLKKEATLIDDPEVTTVQCKKLENILSKADLVKMDIEGGELDALKGMENMDIKYLIVEFNPNALENPDELMKELQKRFTKIETIETFTEYGEQKVSNLLCIK